MRCILCKRGQTEPDEMTVNVERNRGVVVASPPLTWR